jgi:hypothetical protein
VGYLQSPYIPLLHLFAQACEMAQEAREAMRGKALIREGGVAGSTPTSGFGKTPLARLGRWGSSSGPLPWRWLGSGSRTSEA